MASSFAMQFNIHSSIFVTIVLAVASLSVVSALPAGEQTKPSICEIIRCNIPDCNLLRCVNPHLVDVPGHCCPVCACGYDN
ncbi:hypothetical protein BGX21_007624 [Mortierella sp. AD011]|nr:hypothetical protein BGX21_007624 [Mortierella sp. AD011]